MRDSDFAYAVARIRSNELKLLSGQDIEGLLYAESCERALARLADKGWGSGGEDILRAEQNKLWAFIDEILPECRVFDSMKLPNDYHNLKAALKARLAQTDWMQYSMQPATVDIDVVEAAVSSKNFELLPEAMAKAAEEGYEALVSGGDGQRCEVIVDAAALAAVIKAARPYGGILLEQAQLDAYRANVRVAVRCARMKKPLSFVRTALVPCDSVDVELLAQAAVQGEEEICDLLAQTDRDAADALRGGLAKFEKLCSERMDSRLEYTKYQSLGVEPIFAYIYARTKEIRQVRIILAGLRNAVPAERIRELL